MHQAFYEDYLVEHEVFKDLWKHSVFLRKSGIIIARNRGNPLKKLQKETDETKENWKHLTRG